MSIAIVRISSGQVVTVVRPDQPAGWQPPEGCKAVPFNELPKGWQYEPAPELAPVNDTLAGVPVVGSSGAVTISARVITDGDVQVPDSDRGLLLRDENGNDWLLCIAGGAVAAVQVSASPEVSQATRKTRLAEARASVGVLKKANKDKGKGKLTPADRLDAIEAILGIKY